MMHLHHARPEGAFHLASNSIERVADGSESEMA
jgi:hypothetical protein